MCVEEKTKVTVALSAKQRERERLLFTTIINAKREKSKMKITGGRRKWR